MYMQEALELVCRKRKLMNPNDYALLLADMSILIPLDRTVASLQGKRELVLMKRSMLPQIGGDILKATGKTTDPNGKILYPSFLSYTHWGLSFNLQTHVGYSRSSIPFDGRLRCWI